MRHIEEQEEARGGIARLLKLIALHTPYDGSFELRTPGIHAIRLSRTNSELTPSQFSRESGRFFGVAPTRDIQRLREEHHSGAEAPA